MVFKEDIVSRIIKNEMCYREKQNKIKVVSTSGKVNTSKSIQSDDEYTLLLKEIIKERKEKKNEDNLKIETKRKHKSILSKNNEVKCNICKQLFSMKYFTIHLKLHDDDLYKCNICGKNFSYLSILNRHKAIHNNDSVLECKLCNKTFRCSHSLSIHSTFHEWERIKKCRFCFKTFNGDDDFHNHIKTYTFDRPFLCGLCKKSFKTSQSLMDHHKSHIEDIHYLSCSICRMSYADRDTIIKYAK